ncbi:FeoA family protein [Candidatus Terasakiella magnetica]|uniref:FeoA family protein n=1 Tax=Candidatus Terasakiella magnetica TaxID=1867952 RepID=UPI001969A7B9|nr:FeoA family protein [Candidatus Terasakiella magnetica]
MLKVIEGTDVPTLASLKKGEQGYIREIGGDSTLKRKLLSMGIVKGVQVSVSHTAPLGDPRIYTLLGYDLSLRNDEAQTITVDLTKD